MSRFQVISRDLGLLSRDWGLAFMADKRVDARKYKYFFFQKKKIQWSRDKVYALGVWFSATNQETVYLNYIERLEKIKNVLNNWHFRRLTLPGKITVVKTLAMSQLVYVMISLPTCVEILKEVNNLFFKFIRDGKGDKIKRSTLFNEYEDGGLKMLYVIKFSKSLKACWLQKYFEATNNAKWKYFLEESLEKSLT